MVRDKVRVRVRVRPVPTVFTVQCLLASKWKV